MKALLILLLVLFMLGALTTLAIGVVGMFRGNDPKRSNKLMQYRILFQGLALAAFALIMLFASR